MQLFPRHFDLILSGGDMLPGMLRDVGPYLGRDIGHLDIGLIKVGNDMLKTWVTMSLVIEVGKSGVRL